MGALLCIFILIAIVGIYFFNISYRAKGHITYTPGSLSEDAQIIDIDTKRVGSKGDSKYCTIFTFDDGFKYVSHKTRIENHLFYTHISLSKKDIMDLAVFAYSLHEKILNSDQASYNYDPDKEISLDIDESFFDTKGKIIYPNLETEPYDFNESSADYEKSAEKSDLPIATIFSVIAIIISLGVMAYSLTTIDNQQEEISLLKQELAEAQTASNEQLEDSINDLEQEVSSLLLTRKITNSRLESLESTVDYYHSLFR